MAKTRKPRTRIPKDQRRNLWFWAEGAREDILRPHLDGYSRARDVGWVAEREYLQKVCNEFHARVSWRLPDHEEPVLGPFDLEAVIEEEEQSQREHVELLNADPFTLLLSKLSGLSAPPKARQAYQQFMRESHAEKIAPVVAERWAAAQADNDPETVGWKEPKAGFRVRIARKVFAALPQAEKEAIAKRAKDEAAQAKLQYEKALKAPPPNTPEARQACLDGLSDFMAPILRGIYDATGCQSTLLVGSPMPKYSGDLRTLHVAYGRNKTAGAVHFPQWNRERFNNNVLKFMTEYLQTVYTPVDCANAALPTSSLSYPFAKKMGRGPGPFRETLGSWPICTGLMEVSATPGRRPVQSKPIKQSLRRCRATYYITIEKWVAAAALRPRTHLYIPAQPSS
ncbi:hypothetical protein B0H14DRAFT_2620965 [Mycena olivaceomarginata]|nr:hypothetical protein B0H14DRAFT_2620965 [Mycena olivaceomarginata]